MKPRTVQILENVDREGPIRSHMETRCWIWLGYKDVNGYGRAGFRGENRLAHRVVFELVTGKAPEDILRHRCDSRSCVRPDHLVEGTQLDNIADMMGRGRQSRGEGKPSAKLTEDQVREIRERSAESPRALAAEFGVSRRAISDAVNGKTWRHVS